MVDVEFKIQLNQNKRYLEKISLFCQILFPIPFEVSKIHIKLKLNEYVFENEKQNVKIMCFCENEIIKSIICNGKEIDHFWYK
jgi:hypothetical protein